MIESTVAISSTDVAGHYDDLDEYYRMLWGEHLHHGMWINGNESPQEAIINLIRHCTEALLVSRESAICDVGCGYGATARFLVQKEGLYVTGLTISKKQFEYATNQLDGASNPLYILRNWEENDLAPRSFDGLISLECIAHVVDKNRYFSEVHRVLKPGGRAAITAWLGSENAGKWSRYWLLEPICREGSLPSMGTASEYQAMAKAAGLSLVACEDLTQQVRRTWAICLRRVLGKLLFSRVGWRFLLSNKSRHAVFLLSVVRILVAYYTGTMKYGFFVLESNRDEAT